MAAAFDRQIAARASRRCAFAAFAAALALFCAPLAFGWHYEGTDLFRSDVGNNCALRHALLTGQGPWLSSLLGNGGPLAGRPDSQVFYPPRWIALLLAPELAASLFAALHLALAAMGAAWLARTFRVRPLSAFLAGLIFACSGPSLDLIHHGMYVSGTAWLPWAWAGARRALRGRSAGVVPWAAVFVSLVAVGLSGEFQAQGIALALLLFEAALCAVRGVRGARRAGNSLLLGALAVLAACPVWGGFLAEQGLGPRSGSLPLSIAMSWSFTSDLWPAALLPNVAAELFAPGARLYSLLQAEASAWDLTPYLGAVLLSAAVAGTVARRARPALAVFAVGLAFALGAQTPLLPALAKALPFVARFRYPAKYLCVTALGAAMAGAVGFDLIARSRAARRRFLAAALPLAVGLAAVVATACLLADGLQASVERILGPSHAGLPQLPRLPEVLQRCAGQALAVLGAACLALVASARLRRLVAVVALVDLVAAGMGSVPRGPSLELLSSPLSALAPRGAVLCNLASPAGQLVSNQISPDHGSRAYMKFWAIPELNACARLPEATGYSALFIALHDHLSLEARSGSAAASRALGCTHLLSASPPTDEPARELALGPLPAGAQGPRLFEVDDALPEAFVGRDAALLASGRQALERLLASHGAGGALAIADDPFGRLPAGTDLPAGHGVSIASLRWSGRDRASLELAGSGPAVVGLRTLFLKGWSASQRGRPLPVVRLAGDHPAAVVADAALGPVEFEYAIPSWSRLLLTAAAGLAGGLALLACRRAARRK